MNIDSKLTRLAAPWMTPIIFWAPVISTNVFIPSTRDPFTANPPLVSRPFESTVDQMLSDGGDVWWPEQNELNKCNVNDKSTVYIYFSKKLLTTVPGGGCGGCPVYRKYGFFKSNVLDAFRPSKSRSIITS